MLLTATCCIGPCLRAQTPVTLQDYRRQVLEYSYRLKQAAENAEAAYQSARGLHTGFLPQLSADGDFSIHFKNRYGTQDGQEKLLRPYSFSLQPAVVQHEVRSRNGQLGVRGKLGRKADGLRGKAAGQRQPVLPRRDAQRPLPLLAQDAQDGRVRQRPHREPGPEPGAPRKGTAQPGRAGAELRLIIDIAGRRKRAEQLLRRKDGVLRIAPLRRGHCADKAGSGP